MATAPQAPQRMELHGLPAAVKSGRMRQ